MGTKGMVSDEILENTNVSRYNKKPIIALPDANRREYKTDIDKEYGNLLKKKRNEESMYRIKYDIANYSPEYESESFHERQKSGKKIIEFDDNDDELFRYVLQEKQKGKIQRSGRGVSASLEKEKPQAANRNGKNDSCECNTDDDGRSSSVPPPKVPYIFGGSSHANIRNTKNREHKEALEEQIKEKQ